MGLGPDWPSPRRIGPTTKDSRALLSGPGMRDSCPSAPLPWPGRVSAVGSTSSPPPNGWKMAIPLADGGMKTVIQLVCSSELFLACPDHQNSFRPERSKNIPHLLRSEPPEPPNRKSPAGGQRRRGSVRLAQRTIFCAGGRQTAGAGERRRDGRETSPFGHCACLATRFEWLRLSPPPPPPLPCAK